MVIYGEFLFLENFITGALLLTATAKFFRIPIRTWRMTAGSVLCGMAGFTIFLPIRNMYTSIGLRILIALLVVLTALGAKSAAELAKRTAAFLGLTLISGGFVMAALLWAGQPALHGGSGAVYMEAATYGKLIVYGLVGFGLCYGAVKLVRQRRLENSMSGAAKVAVGGLVLELTGFVDSGNELREPLSRRPVVLLGARGRGRLVKLLGGRLPDERYVAVPFAAVGTKLGMLDGLRCDWIEFMDVHIERPVLAFYEGDFREYEALLGKDFLGAD